MGPLNIVVDNGEALE